MALHRDSENLLSAGPGTNLIYSCQEITAAHPERGQSAQNHLAGVTFEWTNGSVFKSSMPFALSNNLSK